MPDDSRENTPSADPFADVLAEILQAEEQGQAPDLERLVTDLPDLEPRLRAYFRDREGFARLAAQLAPTPDGMGAGDSTTPHDASAGPPAPLQPGMRFGGYEILEELGRGGMGVVYKARQLTPERLVALKVIRTDRLEGLPEQERRQWIERFHREAQLVAGLEQHAHIVTLYEVGDHEGQPYFTMQLVAGGSLAQRLRPAGEADAAAANRRVGGQRDNARLLAQAARAVDYAHRRGVLHRDLKPGNILLDADGRPLVGDFGLARRLDETGSLVASGIEGTAAYMAPEQARAAKGAMTTAADVYGLGAILYETLTGRPPFHGKNDLETLLSVLGDEPAHPRALDRRLSLDLATVCLKCLEKEPSRRYPSAAALADDLDNWREGRPINARIVRVWDRVWKWARRRPAVAALTAALSGALVVGFVGMALLWQRAEQQRRLAEIREGEAKRDRGAAEAKTEEAHANLEESNQNLGLARAAVDECFTLTSKSPLLQGDGMQPVREALLRPALRYYQAFLRRRRDDPAVTEELAWAYFRVGYITDLIGQKAESRDAYAEACALWERLAAERPDVRRFRVDLGRALNNLGRAQSATGKEQESLRSYRRSVEVIEALRGGPTPDIELQWFLATACANLGAQECDGGGSADGLRSLARSRQLFQDLVRQSPGDSHCRAELAKIDLMLASHLEKPAEALAAYEEARATLEELLEWEPNASEWQSTLGKTCAELGKLRQRDGATNEASRLLERACTLQEKVVLKNPRVRRYQEYLLEARRNLAEFYRELGRRADALETFQSALSLQETLACDNPDVPMLVAMEGELCLLLGEMEVELGQNAGALHSFRRAYAALTQVVREDPNRLGAQGTLVDLCLNLGALKERAGCPAEALLSYEEARKLLGRLLRQDPENLNFQLRLAATCHHLVAVQRRTRRPAEEAVKSLQEADEVLEKLAARAADVPKPQDLAVCYTNQGGLLFETGRPKEAERWYLRAFSLQTLMVAKATESVEWKEGLARTLRRLGILQNNTRRPDEAAASYQQARDLLRELVATSPENTEFEEELAQVHVDLGSLFQTTGRADESLSSFREAVAIQEKLVERHPEVVEFRASLATTYSNQALGQLAAGRPSDSEQSCRLSLELREKLLANGQDDWALQCGQGCAWHNLALALEDLGRLDEAADAYRRAIDCQVKAFAAAPQVAKYRQFLSNHYQNLATLQRRQGKPAAAAEMVLLRQKLWPDHPGQLFMAARELAACIPLVAPGKADLSDDEKAERQRYADQAMDALRQAKAKGLRNVAAMKQSPELEPLRSREDFQQMVRDLEAKEKGPSP